MSAEQARSEVAGIRAAYLRTVTLETFDYRQNARHYGVEGMNAHLVEVAAGFQPDFVHLGKCELVTGKAVRGIKERTDATVVQMYGDFRWQVQPWVLETGREVDWLLLYHKWPEQIKAYEAEGCKVGFWWYGVDPELFYPREVEREWDVVFMANAPPAKLGLDREERFALIEGVAKVANLHVFGEGWGDLAGTPRLTLHPFVDMEELALAYSKAKVALAHGVSTVPFYTSWRRQFTAMACGALCLSRYFPGLETVFEHGKHLCWFERGGVQAVGHWLGDEGRQIAEAGRAEVVAHHTWDHRIAELLGYARKGER